MAAIKSCLPLAAHADTCGPSTYSSQLQRWCIAARAARSPPGRQHSIVTAPETHKRQTEPPFQTKSSADTKCMLQEHSQSKASASVTKHHCSRQHSCRGLLKLHCPRSQEVGHCWGQLACKGLSARPNHASTAAALVTGPHPQRLWQKQMETQWGCCCPGACWDQTEVASQRGCR